MSESTQQDCSGTSDGVLTYKPVSEILSMMQSRRCVWSRARTEKTLHSALLVLDSLLDCRFIVSYDWGLIDFPTLESNMLIKVLVGGGLGRNGSSRETGCGSGLDRSRRQFGRMGSSWELR
jgi:hypothetical protein